MAPPLPLTGQFWPSHLISLGLNILMWKVGTLNSTGPVVSSRTSAKIWVTWIFTALSPWDQWALRKSCWGRLLGNSLDTTPAMPPCLELGSWGTAWHWDLHAQVSSWGLVLKLLSTILHCPASRFLWAKDPGGALELWAVMLKIQSVVPYSTPSSRAPQWCGHLPLIIHPRTSLTPGMLPGWLPRPQCYPSLRWLHIYR